MNYKKSILSLVAALALGSSVQADSTATYLPLSSSVADSAWVLFGVNGFSTGNPSALGGSSSGAFQAGFTSLIDAVIGDTLATSGLAAAAGGGDMASLQAIDDVGTTSLSVGMDMTGTIFDINEPMRTMYIKVGGVIKNLKLNYKASLEGKGMEILRNNVLYSVKLSQDSTWSAAISATAGGLNQAASVTNKTAMTDILDQNFANNPVNPIYYSKTKHFDATNTLFRGNMYHFNAIKQVWEVWNVNTTEQDFTKLSVGNAYWGRTDRVDIVSNGDGSSGLVLGKSTTLNGIPDPARYQDDTNTSTLTTGWNMLSFDDSKPYIRHAATGIVTTGWANGDTIVIIDDSGLNQISVVLAAGANNEQGWAKETTEAIEAAKLLGTLPPSFNVKVFAGEAAGTNAGTLVFISDKKFSLDATGAAVIPATTLTGTNPYITATGVKGAVADVEATPITSAYGEYGMVVDLMLTDLGHANTAARLDNIAAGTGANVSAKLLFGDATGDNTALALVNAAGALADTDPTTALATTEIKLDPIFSGVDGTGTITPLDVDNDGALDKVVIASTIPFYVKDNTFVRTLAFDTTGTDGAATITVSNVASTTVAPAAAPTTATLVAGLVTAQADAGANTNVYASVGSTATNIIAVATNSDTFDLKDVESATLDFLSEGSDASDIAKGAVGAAYSLDFVATQALVQHEFISTFATEFQPTAAADDIEINVNGTGPTTYAFGAAAIVATTAGRLAFFDFMVASINTEIAAAGVHGYATHDYSEATDDFVGTKIAVSGVGVTSLVINDVAPANAVDSVPTVAADSYAATAGEIDWTNINGDLSADIKTNPIYTPNYAIQGPLYTLRNSGAGYDARAFLKATTEMDTAPSNEIVFDSIDITRNENQWFANNEFNLFKINHNHGYWVYLESKVASSVAIGAATLGTPVYSYYFGNDASKTTTNSVTGLQLSVTITNLDDAVAGSAYAIIGGEKVQLKRTSAASDIFTADVTKYALQSFGEGAPIDISVRAVDGKGVSITKDTAVTFDYAKPTGFTAAANGAASIDLNASGATQFYVFNNFIPEVEATRTTALVDTVTASTLGATGYNACSKGTFGTTYNFRIVAADGTLNNANLSNAASFVYASTLNGAHVLSHTYGTDKATIGALYTTACALEATQPSAPSDNNGVSLKTLTAGQTARMSFVPVAGTNFTQDVAWTAHYALVALGGAVVEIQSTSAYAGQTFFVEYNNVLYTGVFSSSEAAADASIAATLGLTAVVGVQNNTLAP